MPNSIVCENLSLKASSLSLSLRKYRILDPAFLVRNILALSIVSLLADLSTEMILPILPLFLVGTLGATYSFVGLVEGSSDAVSSLVNVISGWYSDRFGRRKPFIVLGYLPTAILKPLFYFVQTPLQVLGIRIPERVGKGFRGAPRDALIAESVDKKDLGKAFGFHRAFDTVGAVIGSFLGFVFLFIITSDGRNSSDAFRLIFVISAIPAAISVVVAQFYVNEKGRSLDKDTIERQQGKQQQQQNNKKINFLTGIKTLDIKLKYFIIVSSVFALANFNLSFFILRAKSIGISDTNILLLYTLFSITYAGISYPFGAVSDRIGKYKVVMIAFVVFIIASVGFAFFSSSLFNIVILFAVLGIYMGIFDGSQKAYITEIAHPSYKATALGIVGTLTGIITLPSSLAAGILWDKFGPVAAFVFASAIASIALGMFIIYQIKLQK